MVVIYVVRDECVGENAGLIGRMFGCVEESIVRVGKNEG